MARAKDEPSWWQRMKASLMWDLLRMQKKWSIGMFVALLFTTLVSLPLSQVQARMIDAAIVEQSVRPGRFLPVLIFVAILGGVVVFGGGMLGQRVAFHLEYVLRTRLYKAVQSAELQRLDRMANGQLITRSLTDLHMIEQFLQLLPLIVVLVPILLGGAIFVIIVSPPMAVLAMLSLPINIWILRRFRHRLRALSWAELNERAEVAAAIDEPVRGIRVVRAFGREEHERARVDTVALRAFRYAMTRWRLLARFDVPMKVVPIVSQAGILLLGAYLLANGSVSTGTFVIAFQMATGFTQVAQIIDEWASQWQYLVSAQNRLGEVLALAEAPPPAGVPLPPPSDGLQMTDVSIELGGRTVLDGVDLEARPGEIVVVTGSPGSGKSTLAAIAAGVLTPDSGEVHLDKIPISALGLGGREAIRIVSEDSYVFATSVRENLELGVVGHADDDTLRGALAAAGADDFIDDLTDGLDSHVGDRGLTLSGGQRQRIALARALVNPPRVLILDDALSAVNPSLEVEILSRIRQFAPQTAVVCISRRRGATTIADRVVTLPDSVVAPEPVETVVGDDSVANVAEVSVAPAMLDIVHRLELTKEHPGVPESVARRDAPPRFTELVSTFKGVAAVAAGVLLVQTFARYGPELLIGDVAEVAGDGDTNALPPRAGVLVVIGLITAGTAYVFRVWSQRFNQGVLYLLRRRVFQRLSRLGIDYYDRELPGEVASKVVYDLDTVSRFMEGAGFQAVSQIARILVGMTLVMAISPGTFPVFAVLCVVMFGVAMVQMKVVNRVFERARDALGKVVSKFEEDATASHDIRSFGAVERQTGKFEEAAWQLRHQRKMAAIASTGFSALSQTIATIAAALVLYRAGNEVLAGAIGVGSAITLRLLASEATQPFQQLGRFYNEFIRARVSFRRLESPWDAEILPVTAPRPIPCPDDLAGQVGFEEVQFTYPHTGRQVLHDISFNLAPGSVTTLVGYTGAGKSSIAKLLSRTYDPDHGRVTVDGIDLRELDLESFRPKIGVVPQDAFVFKGTIASNIAYGHLGATPEQIEDAARAVGAHDVLVALAEGYDHPVEEEGKNLTAAQRQLVALARAWIAQPTLLVLDEATSCLDANLEQKVLEAVRDLEATTLMVTHRDNVARSSDHVVVLDAGRVVEEGPPKKLVGKGGAYDRLWVVVDPAVPKRAPRKRPVNGAAKPRRRPTGSRS